MLIQIAKAAANETDGSHNVHVFETAFGFFVLLIDGSRLFAIDERTACALRSDSSEKALNAFGLRAKVGDLDQVPQAVPLRSLSLAVAQKCNLACKYCYAQQGTFGGGETNMDRDTAMQAVRLLFESAQRDEPVNLAFLGGEPLVNRALIHECTDLASNLSRTTGVPVTFSITTNGTLLTEEDGRFFEDHGFAVTVSLDGIGETNDALRPFRNGRGTYAHVLARVRPVLQAQKRMQVSARVTVTPKNLQLKATLDELLGIGFHSVGFSPMLYAPSGEAAMQEKSLEEMLQQMIECGEEFERRTFRGERYAFSNVASAIQEIHKGTHRPYPCGAGGGYFGVSADGGLYTCHRFVKDETAYFGDVWRGVDSKTQTRWLSERHVHNQLPCSRCWARYLCGGGCHHEVMHRGRPACDYIRGWLDYCLKAYVRVWAAAPEYFA
jgi:uncharacterized protein